MRKNVLISTTRQWNPATSLLCRERFMLLNTHMEIYGIQSFLTVTQIYAGGSRWRNRTRTSAYTYIWDQKDF